MPRKVENLAYIPALGLSRLSLFLAYILQGRLAYRAMPLSLDVQITESMVYLAVLRQLYY